MKRWLVVFVFCSAASQAVSETLVSPQPDFLPEEQQEILEKRESLSFPEWDRFRILHGDQLVPEGDAFVTVDAKGAGRVDVEWANAAIRWRLAESPCSVLTLRKLLFRYPGSTLEPVILQEIAKKTPVEKALASEQVLRVSMTRIQDTQGQTLFQDMLPEELWGTLLPSRVWDEKENPVREVRTSTSPCVLRMGTRTTIWPPDEREMRPQGYLVAIDLTNDGRLLWLVEPESPKEAFAGEPCIAEGYVWVPLVTLTSPRRFSLAAFDLQTGEQAGRTFLFSAETTATQLNLPLIREGNFLLISVSSLKFYMDSRTGILLRVTGVFP